MTSAICVPPKINFSTRYSRQPVLIPYIDYCNNLLTSMPHLSDQPYNFLSSPVQTVVALLILLAVGCAPRQEPITETEVVRTVEGFFQALDVENTDANLLDAYVTSDFIIYEAGQKMDKAAFKAFASGSKALETDWELSDFRISTDAHSAHASFFNRGNFVVQADSVRVRIQIEWLESAFLVRQADSLKIKFYFSDRVGMKSDTLR